METAKLLKVVCSFAGAHYITVTYQRSWNLRALTSYLFVFCVSCRDMGELIVRVIKGSNLVIGDHIVKNSDPYVVIRLGEQTKKTSVKKKTLNPVWDEGLTFTDVFYRDHCLLTVEVLDEDKFPKFKRKDFLGDAEIDLQPLLEESYPMATGKKVVAQSNNIYLAKDSWIVQQDDGRIVQDVCLKLGSVKSGLLEMRLEWQPEG